MPAVALVLQDLRPAIASRRVLENCGFRVIASERSFAEARSAEIEELVLRLDEPASAD